MRVITFIGLITFIISCFLPCFSVRDSSFDYMGYTALFFGWAGVFINSELTVYYISWYANILFLISLFIKSKSLGIILLTGSLILGCLFHGCPYIVINEAGKHSDIVSLQIGYYIWILSFFILLIGRILRYKE